MSAFKLQQIKEFRKYAKIFLSYENIPKTAIIRKLLRGSPSAPFWCGACLAIKTHYEFI